MEKREKKVITCLLIMAGVLVSLPLFSNTVFSSQVMTHDTFFHTQRIWSIKNALAEGQFPVRIYSEIFAGYGYGSPLYYPDLFLYLPAILCLLGVPLAVSYNIFLILVNFATLAISYYSYSRIAKSRVIGIAAAVLYSLSTYRLLDLYTRGAVGELLALTFCPLALCGLTFMKRGEYHKWWILALAYTGLLQSHILSFVMMAGTAVLYALFHCKSFLKAKSILGIVKAGGLWLLLNVWFLLPFLQEMQLHGVWGNASFWQTGATFTQLFDVLLLSVTGTEPFGGAIKESIPKTPGVLLIIGAILLIFSLILYGDEIKEEKKRVLGCLIPGVLALIMVTNLFPWQIIQQIPGVRGLLTKFQFIWRFNILGILFLSLAAAYGFYYFFIKAAADKQRALILVCMTAGMFALIFINQFVKQGIQYSNEEVLQNGYMDSLYLPFGFAYIEEGDIESNSENVECSDVTYDYGSFSCDLTCTDADGSEDGIYVDVPLAYYSGYKAYLNEEELDTVCGAKGLVRLYLPTGCEGGHLVVFYEDSGVAKAANIVSLLAWVGLFWGVVLQRRKGRA